MCGIAGLLQMDGAEVDASLLSEMTDALAHRGPDGRGVYVRGNVGIGHRRLSIVDLSTAGAQPMRTQDGTIALTFNGEIYNFREEKLRLQAKGYSFQSDCDTEVLLRLYEEEGPTCVQRLRGMFAFAVIDYNRNILFLARDRVGKKPLKYFRVGTTFAFASELKALYRHPLCPSAFDHEALHHFLTLMYVPAPRTGLMDIYKLPAAHTLTVNLSTGEERLERYWELQYEPQEGIAVEEWKERIAHAFDESVRLRMVADVPLGAFLSGGIDSAAVVAFMACNSEAPVKTFSIGSTASAYNELPDAQLIAERFGTEHHPLMLEPDIIHLLPDLVRTYEEPYADPSAIPLYLLAHATRPHVTVALNGDGGDENFAGYVRYGILQFSLRWQHIPLPVHWLVHRGVEAFHALRRSTFSYRVRRFQATIRQPWEQRYLHYVSFFTEEEKRHLEVSGFAAEFPSTFAWYAHHTRGSRTRSTEMLRQAIAMDIDTYLADDLLPKVDMGTMAHGLEARSPFLDHRFMELAACIPSDLLIRGGSRKWIIKTMLQGMLPPEHLAKRKRGFRLPLNDWFRGELRGFVHDRLMEASPAFWEMIDRTAMERLLHDYYDSHVDYSDHIWALLWLDEWMRQYTCA